MESFVTVVTAYLGLLMLAFLGQRRLIYFPDREAPVPSAWGVGEMAEVDVNQGVGRPLLAWFRLPREKNKPTLLLFHGNAGHIGHRAAKARYFLDRGYGVMLAEYRGYGGNPGAPHEQGLYEDGRAALRALTGLGIGHSDIVLYGESLGTGVAVDLAMGKTLAGLVLEAPFTTLVHLAAKHYPFIPWRLLARDRFDSLSKIAMVTAPLLILHGATDREIPPRFGERLFKAAAEPKEMTVVEGAGHNDLYEYGGAAVVLEFLDNIVASRKAADTTLERP